MDMMGLRCAACDSHHACANASWNIDDTGELANSCRMDEYPLFGGFVTGVNHAEKAEI